MPVCVFNYNGYYMQKCIIYVLSPRSKTPVLVVSSALIYKTCEKYLIMHG